MQNEQNEQILREHTYILSIWLLTLLQYQGPLARGLIYPTFARRGGEGRDVKFHVLRESTWNLPCNEVLAILRASICKGEKWTGREEGGYGHITESHVAREKEQVGE